MSFFNLNQLYIEAYQTVDINFAENALINTRVDFQSKQKYKL